MMKLNSSCNASTRCSRRAIIVDDLCGQIQLGKLRLFQTCSSFSTKARLQLHFLLDSTHPERDAARWLSPSKDQF